MKFFMVLACIAAASADVSHIAHNTHYLPPTTAKPFIQYAPTATPAPFAPIAPIAHADHHILPSISTYSSFGHLPAVASISATAAPAIASFESLPAVGPTFSPYVSTATAAPAHVSYPASLPAATLPATSTSFVTAPKVSAPVLPSLPSLPAVSTTSYVSAPKSVAPLSAPVPYTTYSYPSGIPSAYPATYSSLPSAYSSLPATYSSLPSAYSSLPSTYSSYPAYTTSGVLGGNYHYPSAPVYTQPISTVGDYSAYYPGLESIYGGLTSSSLYAPSTVSTDAAVVDAKIAAPVAPLKPVIALPTTTPAPATTPAPIFKPIDRVEEIPAASFNDVDGYVYKTPEH